MKVSHHAVIADGDGTPLLRVESDSDILIFHEAFDISQGEDELSLSKEQAVRLRNALMLLGKELNWPTGP